MSVDIFILSNRTLPDTATWQKAIDEQGHDLILHADISLATHTGFLPAVTGEDETGFECSAMPIDEIREMFPDADLGGSWSNALVIYYGGDVAEGYAANVSAAAYAKATGGVVFDPQGGSVYSEADSLKDITYFKSQMG
jgi:hypothetical protein